MLLPSAVGPEAGERAGDAKQVAWDLELAPAGEPGTPFVLEGRVMDSKGSRPVRDALVHVYHADDAGQYSRSGASGPRLSGTLRTNVLGGFRIRTVLPGSGEGSPHMHFEIAGPGADYRALTFSLCRAEGAGSDTTFARLPQMPSLPSEGAWANVRRDAQGVFRCRWDLPFDKAVRLRGRPAAFRPGR